MFKTTLLGFHFLTSVLLSGYKGDVQVVNNISEISAAIFQEVELIIVKESFEGPAKLTIDWNSSNVEVEEISSSGASFSHDEDQSLYIWYSIASDNVITLNYKVKGNVDLSKVKAYFSYVEDGKKVKVPVSSSNLILQ